MITAMPRIAIAVRDFEACIELFRNQLGMPVVDLASTSVSSLGAKLAMCVPESGSNIELMSPADPAAPLSQSLSRFLERRGEGLFALMLEAPDPDREAERLIEHGLNVLPLMEGAGGRDVHPNCTHGVLIRVYPVNSFQPSGNISTPERGLSGLSGIERVIIAVRDLESAADVYGRRFELPADKPAADQARGVRSCICRPPGNSGVIELVAVEDPSRPFAARIQKFLDDRGEGLFSLVLHAEDIEQTATALAEAGMQTSNTLLSALWLDPADTFGAQVSIEPVS